LLFSYISCLLFTELSPKSLVLLALIAVLRDHGEMAVLVFVSAKKDFIVPRVRKRLVLAVPMATERASVHRIAATLVHLVSIVQNNQFYL
jgi:hypothetical protein